MTTKFFLSILAFLFLSFFAVHAVADPKLRAFGQEGEIILLYDEPCAFKDVVSNLKYRATWQEKGKTFEGCWNLSPFGIVVLYMSNDKTMFVIPAQMFEQVSGA